MAATLAAPTLLEHATEAQRIGAGAAHRDRRGGLVPALQRARLGIGPGQRRDTGRARRGRVGRHRPEGVELRGGLGGLRHAAGPDRRRRAQARRHHLLRHRHEAARDRGAAAQADERRVELLRGLPDRGPGPRRPRHRRRSTGAGGWRRRRCSTSATPWPAVGCRAWSMARSGSDGDLDRKVGEVLDRAREVGQGPQEPASGPGRCRPS